MPKKINPDGRAHENILALYSYMLANTQPISLTALSEKFKVSKPTMSRYLDALESSNYGKVNCETIAKENFYSLDRPKNLPKISLSVEGLQQLALCRDFMKHLLPYAEQRNLDAVLNLATAYLPDGDEIVLPEVATCFTRGKINYEPFQYSFKKILTAVKNNLVCELSYKGTNKEKSYKFAPKKVVAIGEAIHIKGWTVTDDLQQKYDAPLNIILHRVIDVVLTDFSSNHLPEVKQLDNGYFGYINEEEFEVKIQIKGYPVTYVAERIWSSKQHIEHNDDGSITLTMMAQSVWELRTWVLSFAENAKVISPEWFKNEVATSIKKLSEVYNA